MLKCKNCSYSCCGEPDSLSDWCDECRNDPDTGWGGFTDHSVGEHFMNEQEQGIYYDNYDVNKELEYIQNVNRNM